MRPSSVGDTFGSRTPGVGAWRAQQSAWADDGYESSPPSSPPTRCSAGIASWSRKNMTGARRGCPGVLELRARSPRWGASLLRSRRVVVDRVLGHYGERPAMARLDPSADRPSYSSRSWSPERSTKGSMQRPRSGLDRILSRRSRLNLRPQSDYHRALIDWMLEGRSSMIPAWTDSENGRVDEY